ncbi:MAG: glycerate kinase [Planctomycetota bacterium]
MSEPAALLRAVYADVLDHIRDRLQTWVPRCVGVVPDQLADDGRVLLIAFGKAARPMAERALATLAPIRERVHGLLVPANDDDAPLPPLEVVPGGHPLPTAGSFAAGRRALQLAAGAGDQDFVVFLASGGGSSLLEVPLDDAVTVDGWRAFQQALVGSGASIDRINAVRMRLSAVKGGRLGIAAGGARDVRTLFVSDVPGGVETIASGPTAMFEQPADTLRRDLDELQLWQALPEALRRRAERDEIPPLPEMPDRVASRSCWMTIADEHHARQRAAAHLRGSDVVVDDELDVDDLPYEIAADRSLARLEQLARRHPGRPVAVVVTGELSVPLPPSPGTGGRNLQFALRCAERIAGRPITVLSCGTDGVDGNSPAAGAVVDGDTAARAATAGLDVDDHLRRCDAYPLLRQLGCAVEPGPTGTNVRDLRVLLKPA